MKARKRNARKSGRQVQSYASKNFVVRQPPRLGNKIMLHIRLMIFRQLNDSEEIRGQMPEGWAGSCILQQKWWNRETSADLPSLSSWPSEIPSICWRSPPCDEQQLRHQWHSLLPADGRDVQPVANKNGSQFFFDFICASLNFTSRPSSSQSTRPPVPLHLLPFVLLAAAVPTSGRNTAHGQCLKMFQPKERHGIHSRTACVECRRLRSCSNKHRTFTGLLKDPNWESRDVVTKKSFQKQNISVFHWQFSHQNLHPTLDAAQSAP